MWRCKERLPYPPCCGARPRATACCILDGTGCMKGRCRARRHWADRVRGAKNRRPVSRSVNTSQFTDVSATVSSPCSLDCHWTMRLASDDHAPTTTDRLSLEGARALTTHRLRVFLVSLSVLLVVVAVGHWLSPGNGSRSGLGFRVPTRCDRPGGPISSCAAGNEPNPTQFSLRARSIDAVVSIGVPAALHTAFLIGDWGTRPGRPSPTPPHCC